MSATATAFARRLRALRTARGLSQQVLAERADLSETAISAYERGLRYPRPRNIDQLAAALAVQPQELAMDGMMVREGTDGRYRTTAPARDSVDDLLQVVGDQPDSFVRLVADIARRILADRAHQA